jgi:hypothetical protein
MSDIWIPDSYDNDLSCGFRMDYEATKAYVSKFQLKIKTNEELIDYNRKIQKSLYDVIFHMRSDKVKVVPMQEFLKVKIDLYKIQNELNLLEKGNNDARKLVKDGLKRLEYLLWKVEQSKTKILEFKRHGRQSNGTDSESN